MIFKKHFKIKPVPKVRFNLYEKEANSRKKVNIKGAFSLWDTDALPMKKLKNGAFTATVDFDQREKYQPRYLLDNID